MATKSGLFYAYAKHDGDNWSGRFLITFASRAVADEWWRAITNSVQRGNTRFSRIVRHTMHFYSYHWESGIIYETLDDAEITAGNNLKNQVFFTLLHDRDGRVISPAPVLDYTDHRSGNEFFIRSMLQPEIFWFYDSKSDLIRPSKYRRSKFTISVLDPERRLGPDPIMIPSDPITITIDTNLVFVSYSSKGVEDEASEPWARTKRVHKEVVIISELRFSDFDGGFEVRFDDNDPEDLKSATIVPTPGRKGDRWELV